jgi:hypothetical protein
MSMLLEKNFKVRLWFLLLRILKRTQTRKGIPTRTLCQKNQGTVKIKQKLVTMGDRTTHRAPSLKGYLFKLSHM